MLDEKNTQTQSKAKVYSTLKWKLKSYYLSNSSIIRKNSNWGEIEKEIIGKWISVYSDLIIDYSLSI